MTRQIVLDDLTKIKDLLSIALGQTEYDHIERLGGLTNHTYQVTLKNGEPYVVRIPGEGTQAMIDRSNERISTQLACGLGIDTQLLYFGDDGSKVTAYLPDPITMSAPLLGRKENISHIAQILRTLHNCKQDTHVPFEIFDMSENYERVIAQFKVPMFDDFSCCKQAVMDIKSTIDQSHPAQKVPCHNDPLCENWVWSNGRMYLIDWEYAGMNDGMWDLADVSLEAGFHASQDTFLLCEYLQRPPEQEDLRHFLANKIYVDYLWTLWAKARVPYDGQPMEDWAAERYARLKENLRLFYPRG